ncbi:MAG: isoaspartyl peptidase/L-asparaginase [Halobacteriales archaeon]
MQVLVHGGAGGAPRSPRRRQDTLDAAAAAGLEAGDPEAAVVRAVTTLERSRRFNAGRGATIQSDGVHRADAALMTDDRGVGAVCGLRGVATPIEVARVVKAKTPHVLLGHPGAGDLAAHLGLDGATVGMDRTRERFAEADVPESVDGQLAFVRERFGTGDRDTVGAVAREGERLAAATSTGGRFLAFRGRIGDVPQVGCGFYCSTHGAVSTTGDGEDIARLTVARAVERELADGADAQAAVVEALATLDRETDGGAGAIAIGADGSVGTGFTTARMQTAYAAD